MIRAPRSGDRGGTRTTGALPRVTIMIPTFNQADLVLDAVDSALAQDYPNLEVVVADDASPDDTAAVVATRSDPRLRYHRNPVNLGRVGNYRHALYELATGEWVVNLDGDDYYTDEEFVSAAVSLAARDTEVLVVMARARMPGDGSGGPVRAGVEDYVVPGHHLLYEIAYERRELFHLATLYRRAPALALGFYSRDTLSSDAESICRLAVRGKVAFMDRCVGVWRVSDASASLQSDWRRMIEALMFWPDVFADAVARGMSKDRAREAQRRAIGLMAYGYLSRLIDSGHDIPLREAMWVMARSLGMGPAAFLATRWRIYARAGRSRLRRTLAMLHRKEMS